MKTSLGRLQVQSSKDWGTTQQSGGRSLTTHQQLGPAPKNYLNEPTCFEQAPSIAPYVDIGTVNAMPISSGHLRALTTERLKAARPIFAPIHASPEALAKRRPFLAAVINGAPAFPTVMQLSLVPLDFGRIHLGDANRLLGWSAGTQLEWSITDDHLHLTAVDKGTRAIDSQGRFLLQIAARRRLGVTDAEQVLIITSSLPSPHVLIYPCAALINALSQRKEI
jgi:hypothetical protein